MNDPHVDIRWVSAPVGEPMALLATADSFCEQAQIGTRHAAGLAAQLMTSDPRNPNQGDNS